MMRTATVRAILQSPADWAAAREILCTDGGMLSNFPVVIFGRTDNLPPRWPTFGVKLSARHSLAQATWSPTITTATPSTRSA